MFAFVARLIPKFTWNKTKPFSVKYIKTLYCMCECVLQGVFRLVVLNNIVRPLLQLIYEKHLRNDIDASNIKPSTIDHTCTAHIHINYHFIVLRFHIIRIRPTFALLPHPHNPRNAFGQFKSILKQKHNNHRRQFSDTNIYPISSDHRNMK